MEAINACMVRSQSTSLAPIQPRGNPGPELELYRYPPANRLARQDDPRPAGREILLKGNFEGNAVANGLRAVPTYEHRGPYFKLNLDWIRFFRSTTQTLTGSGRTLIGTRLDFRA